MTADGIYGRRINGTPIELERAQNIEDGLLMSAIDLIGTPPDTRRTHEELAHYCNVSKTAIQEIEKGALIKVRKRLGGLAEELREVQWPSLAAGEKEGPAWNEQIELRKACDALFRRKGWGRFA